MSLIKSIAGIRGTIGGKIGDNLTPIDVVNFSAAFGLLIINKNPNSITKIVIGRDARITGPILSSLVSNTLISLGINVVDLKLASTPTISMAVIKEKASGGIILSASHNPANWNALKLLNSKGEFISFNDGLELEKIINLKQYEFANHQKLGSYINKYNYLNTHIDSILSLDLINVSLIKSMNFKIVVDGINSVGGVAVPKLLDKLGVEVVKLNCDPTGNFSHNPEPLAENIKELCSVVVQNKADLGIVVDPDVDRLAFVDENGIPFGEEYTLVACSDYVLSKKPGNTVSNLSSTKALKIVTEKYNKNYYASAVGELNVVEMMKKKNAVIGGEGNGGVILPELHYGRDALIGIALFLSLISERNKNVSSLKNKYPIFYMNKSKLDLKDENVIEEKMNMIINKYSKYKPITIDGIKINFTDSWIHLRKSNTEPVIRLYSEAKTKSDANSLIKKFIKEII